MKKAFFRFLCAALLLAIVFSSISCKEKLPEADGGGDTELTETEPFSLTEEYKIVRPDDRRAAEVSAVSLLARGIKSAYGVTLGETTDFTKYGEDVKPNEFEILVGATNRAESQAAYAELSYYDWTYKIVSENVIVICGGSPEATLAAAEAFLADVIGYKESNGGVTSKGSAAALASGTLKSYSHVYAVRALAFGTVNVKNYSIVTVKRYTEAAEALAEALNKLSGVRLPIITPEEYKGGNAIFFGMANESGAHLDHKLFGSKRYYVEESDGDLIFDFTSVAAANAAVERFVGEILPKDAKGNVSIKTDSLSLTGLIVSTGTNSLKTDSVSSSPVANGITYEERVYFDPDGKPVRVYALTVAPGSARIETSMPNDGTETGKVSNIKNQINSAVSNGKNVIAGINADFFDMGGTNVMRGLCIKNGVFIHGTDGRPWFGITSNGDAVIGEAEDYAAYSGNLINAVGGYHILIKNDSADEVTTGTEFSDTRHPRTAVGVKSDGSIVFAVVDGRQSSVSNGATLADLAEIMAQLGCVNAINLDGGGSSTFVLKENGSFNVKNSPSGGSLRAVANGLMVIIP